MVAFPPQLEGVSSIDSLVVPLPSHSQGFPRNSKGFALESSWVPVGGAPALEHMSHLNHSTCRAISVCQALYYGFSTDCLLEPHNYPKGKVPLHPYFTEWEN